MISLSIPGWGELSLEYLVVDFNGTVAVDGKLRKDARDALDKISRYLKIFVLTADS